MGVFSFVVMIVLVATSIAGFLEIEAFVRRENALLQRRRALIERIVDLRFMLAYRELDRAERAAKQARAYLHGETDSTGDD